MIRPLALVTIFMSSAICSAAIIRPALVGRVVDANGKPLPHTTVLVYHAGVKVGYSTFCPSCYSDCGKRVFTNENGDFRIKDLAPDLWFDLLFVQDGYIPQFARKVDPAKAAKMTLTLATRPAVTNYDGVVNGRVEDSVGSPIGDAVISPIGLIVGNSSRYGSIDGLQPIAVTNKMGEFEISYARPTPKILLKIEARAMAPKFVAMDTGPVRHSVALADGAAITGRLLANGKPVSNVEIGLIAKNRGGFGPNLTMTGNPYSEMRVGTKSDGSFTFTNVPQPVDWYIYPKMNTISQLGAASPIEVKTIRDNQYARAENLLIGPGHVLRGTVVLSDNKPIPEGMHITIDSDLVWDSQTVLLATDGHFEFASLPAGDYHISPSVKNYRVKGTPGRPFETPVSIDHDVEDFTITVYPEISR